MVSVPGMTAMVFMASVMLPRMGVARRLLGPVRVMVLSYRRVSLVEVPGRGSAGSMTVGVVMMIVRLIHLVPSVLSIATWLA
ncbi:hypothetical protein [Dietzia psychralcaliphila]|uniref:Uncharacterized protein n=1 Tax=Dietzia psychralcaliphila TaxID=139021 RepID=A0AAD0JSD3_9ACTN|nr:hypothetical protein [Dietzia psychralcaliphila]AWH95974.1 hypothetical protein A6048_11215 [Dietzia psychralcaliphila]PTM91009.1 hypothetical protein C8N39_101770 [Dietzia psychralcaliphila]